MIQMNQIFLYNLNKQDNKFVSEYKFREKFLWYKQEIKALNWQIKNEAELIHKTEKRIEHVKNGGKDGANCDLKYLKKLLIKVKKENGNAKKRKEVFLMEHEPSDKIKTDIYL